MRSMTLAALGATLLAIAGCKSIDSADPNISAAPPAANGSSAAKAKPVSNLRTVTYRIGGTASSASITYTTPSGQEQQNGTNVPWHKTFKVKKADFAMLDVTAQNSGGGTISCEIEVDGKVLKRSKSSGAYALASCDASLGF